MTARSAGDRSNPSGSIPGCLDLLRQFFPFELRLQQSLARPDDRAHLRVSDHIGVHDRGDAVNDLAFRRECTVAERREQKGNRGLAPQWIMSESWALYSLY